MAVNPEHDPRLHQTLPCLSVETVSRWERGKQVPNLNDLEKILKQFSDINPTWKAYRRRADKKTHYNSIIKRASEHEAPPQTVIVD